MYMVNTQKFPLFAKNRNASGEQKGDGIICPSKKLGGEEEALSCNPCFPVEKVCQDALKSFMTSW